MADKRISDFPTLTEAQDTDLILVSSEQETYNVSFATLKEGTKGAPGEGIVSYTEYFAINNSTTAPADSAFSTSVVNPTASNRYLWGYTKIMYTDDTELVTNKRLLCVYGTQGISISSMTSYFLRSANKTGVTRNTSGWSTTVPELTNSYPYMWNYERFYMTDGTYKYTTPCVVGSIGTKGDKGDKGDTGKTAYQAAVEKGYTGTETQFATDMANSASNAAICTQKASDAYSAATTATNKASEAASSASSAASAADTAVNNALVNYYNKTQVDDLLDPKANSTDVSTQIANATANSVDYTTSGTDRVGVAIGQTSTGTAAQKKFEVAADYTSIFNGGIQGVTNYVAGETLTGGTWIDGKPIYRFVAFVTDVTEYNNIARVLATLPDLPDTVISVRGMFRGATTYGTWAWYPMPNVSPSSSVYRNVAMLVRSTTGEIVAWWDKDTEFNRAKNVLVIVEYTKAD